ncbi:TIGR04211 family SH3 domain-containing protein [Nitrosomonas sp.]|uniref:TIGR04211 family SH3 domain-containing protein n=2 Tax=Nitrosomonas sp. TaxID=42353 RepID=UPI00273222A9|nr:TIGR04211 family SH3 domain-containing protein [Nitrosomonas sp.]MDP1786688.1 TIGR04211 family SH3 domain-containing protein [Nitrosomonas sp.]
MQKHVYTRILFACLLLISTQLSAKNIQYVSDELTIPMRSGPTTSHKILKFLTSGTMVDVLDVSDDKKHTRIVLIKDESKSGWVETRLLMSQPSAREQLIAANKSSQALKEKQATLKTELAELQKKNAEFQEVQSQLENKYLDLQNTLLKLRTNAAEPIRIADENDQLKQQLHYEQNKNIDLVKNNAFLADQNIKQWFMIGAGVSIGSLILGLLITRIRWKRRDSWGDVR